MLVARTSVNLDLIPETAAALGDKLYMIFLQKGQRFLNVYNRLNLQVVQKTYALDIFEVDISCAASEFCKSIFVLRKAAHATHLDRVVELGNQTMLYPFIMETAHLSRHFEIGTDGRFTFLERRNTVVIITYGHQGNLEMRVTVTGISATLVSHIKSTASGSFLIVHRPSSPTKLSLVDKSGNVVRRYGEDFGIGWILIDQHEKVLVLRNDSSFKVLDRQLNRLQTEETNHRLWNHIYFSFFDRTNSAVIVFDCGLQHLADRSYHTNARLTYFELHEEY